MKNPYIRLLKTSWKFAEGRRARIVITYFMFVCANTVEMAGPFVFGKLLNTVQEGGPNLLPRVAMILGLFVSLDFFFWIFHGNARVSERETGFHIVTAFKDYAYKAITSLPIKWHKDNHSGAVINRVGKAAKAMESFTDDSYIFIQTIVKFIISLSAIFYFLPLFGFIPLTIAVIIVLVIFRFDRFITKSNDTMNEQYHGIASAFHDYVSNIGTVITLRLEELTRSELLRKIGLVLPLFKKVVRVNEIKWFSINMGLTFVNFFVIFVYIRAHVLSGEVIMIGSLMALYQYTDKFIAVFYDLAWKYEKLVMLNTDLNTADPIFDAYEKLGKNSVHIKSPRNWDIINISDLNFQYDDDQNNAKPLKNITIGLERGLRIAFIGESGSGKSTMLSLLRGLFDADSVHVDIDGKKYASLRVLSDWVTLIPQDPEIFENSIEYNVTIGVRHKKDEVMDAIKQARFDRVLARLPHGLETNIKEKGVNLSGGEKQRLAVARGLFAGRSSSILLLDEPTSSMDSHNETAIYKNIFADFPDACLISSVHRLNLLKMFDVIYLFDGGKIIESGSFEELLKNGGAFTKIWERFLHKDNKK